MAQPVFYTGDTWPPLQGIAKDASGAAVPLAGASSYRMIAKGTTAAVIAGTAVLRDPSRGGDGVGTDGKWEYIWGAGDLAAADTYVPEIEVTWSTGKIETFRTDTETFLVKADND
jgi:hypothetical protein